MSLKLSCFDDEVLVEMLPSDGEFWVVSLSCKEWIVENSLKWMVGEKFFKSFSEGT